MFSRAVGACQLLTGRKPYGGESDVAEMYKIATIDPAAPSLLRVKLATAFGGVLLRALAKNAHDRSSQWSDFAARLGFSAVKRDSRPCLPERMGPVYKENR